MKRIPLVKAFTLIEMLVVVVIIAVLAIVALPRFLNIQTDGRIALFDAAQSQFQTAITFAHSKWLVSGGGNAEMNDMPGFGEDGDGNAQLDINDVGYPLGVDKGNPMGQPYNIGQGDQGCVSIWNAIMTTDLTATTDPNQSNNFDFITRRQNHSFVAKDGTPQNKLALCYFIYTGVDFDSDPGNAGYVFWYNSRTGEVTQQDPNNP
ncbi:prepilin-type N-terminal cleavage/methylation domain-containing protein [Vibrio sp. 10N.222.54.A1]|jgi:prepilin-type N-terminal cleavage/methylation domain-containing protein|uniref:prepilin-type N-terminal cleavage/methylation domain-containing protein n=1 Tax=Vibrio TaxID=662 RepID=UPI00031B3F43|nr:MULTISPECIES: prepilin-type N-terminal cleavage/methylation domain-containing protein [Vibrio]OEF07954.1 hypothetical protein A138_09940 [Vibrio crassostreae 9ZC77]PMK09025.1 hypothetical protein BCU07_16380 [Vibrio sp. 10N.261.54.E10]PMK82134.1 hypothetical protein BCT92_01795 [Vibrio sp. 10N.261.52.E5]PML73985.1 hypothetical protein BCT71_06890 [Vibrio sp. 10N.261.51.A7]PMO01140.1 hypothetical protein BCT21_08730 [Vibrio sp. 10N.222.55.F9]